MLAIIENEFEISEAQQRFAAAFQHVADERIPVKIGYLGNSFNATIMWCTKLNLWFYPDVVSGSRYWNAFGVVKPKRGENTPITCEINFPLKNVDRRVAGAFVTDGQGNIFVVHRGKIGGGREGIGKSLFQANYGSKRVAVKDGEVESTVALVGALNSPHFVKQVSWFVYEVARIKELASSGSLPTEDATDIHEFQEEFSGKKKYGIEKQVEAQCDHGLVVNRLATILGKSKHRVGNDQNRDLYIADAAGRITTLFEVKTDMATTSLYTAVGQLMLHGVALDKRLKLVLVVPRKVDETLEDRLNKLDIELLTYQWQGDEIVFPELASLGL